MVLYPSPKKENVSYDIEKVKFIVLHLLNFSSLKLHYIISSDKELLLKKLGIWDDYRLFKENFSLIDIRRENKNLSDEEILKEIEERFI